MKKRFIENLAFFATLNLIIKPIYVFGIDMYVQNKLGPTIYGTYFPLFNLVIIFQIFLDLGIENYTRKEIAHNPEITDRIFSSFLLLKLILIVLFILLFTVAGYLLPHNKEESRLLFMLVINQSLASLILYLRANMGGLLLFKAEGITSVLDRLIMVFICGSLLIIPFTKDLFTIQWFVLAQTIAYSITLIFSFIIVSRKIKSIKIKFDFKYYIPVLHQLKPFAFLAFLMAIYYRVDVVFLRYLLPDGKEQAGVYAHGFRIIDFMSNYALIFSFILLPTFAKNIREKVDIAPLLRLSVTTLIIPSVAILIGTAFYRHDIFQILYPQSDNVSADVFLILIFSFLGVCISYTFGALLTANGNLKELIHMAIIAVIISSVLNIILIPKFKVTGAAFSNAVSQIFTIFFHVIVTSKKFKLKPDLTLLYKSTIFIIFTVSIAYLLSISPLNWIVGILLIPILSMIFAVVIKLIKISYLFDFIKSYSHRKDLSTS